MEYANEKKMVESSIKVSISDERRRAIIIVTYNKVPNLGILEKSLKFIDYIFIIDNNSIDEVAGKLRYFASVHRERVFLRENNKNLGLAIPINDTVESFSKLGVSFFYIFDQDATFDLQYFSESETIWNECLKKGIKVGLVVPIIGDQESLLGERLNIKKKTSYISSAITSGMMTSVEVFKEVGGFNPHFFVYGVDIDFSQRLIKKGFKICRINKIYIIQYFGEPVEITTLKSKVFFELSRINSIFTLRFNMINAYHSQGYTYSADRIDLQLDSSREINRMYCRMVPELYRLVQKYLTHRQRKNRYEKLWRQ